MCKPITMGIDYGPLWKLMHNEHGLILLETELEDIMAACKVIEEHRREANN